MNVQVWIGDLAEYNEGNLKGDWFMLPMDLDDILEDVLEEGNEEWYIGDTDCEINVNGLSFNELNELAEFVDNLDSYEIETFKGLMEYYNDLESAKNIMEDGDYTVYSNCRDMSEVAYEYYEMTGQLSEITKHIPEYYIDFEAIGRDMEINGTFVQVGNDYIEIHN